MCVQERRKDVLKSQFDRHERGVWYEAFSIGLDAVWPSKNTVNIFSYTSTSTEHVSGKLSYCRATLRAEVSLQLCVRGQITRFLTCRTSHERTQINLYEERTRLNRTIDDMLVM